MLRFRPHHFLCTLGFEGKGYSDDFVAGFKRIADSLREAPSGDETLIEVAEATDAICEPCPNRRGELCESETKIRKLDAGHAAVLGLKPGDRLTWGEAKKRIAAKMTDSAFDSVCAPCSWKSMGVCHAALERLRKAAPALLIALALALGGSHSALASKKKKRAGREPAKAQSQGKSKKKKAKPAPPVDDPEAPLKPVPIDTLQEHLIEDHKSKKVRSLKKAFDELKAKHYANAKKLATPFQGDKLYSDYGYWIVAAATYEEAAASYKKKRYAEAAAAADRAITAYQKLENVNPYSSFLKTLSKDVATAEILKGDALAEAGKWKASQPAFELGMQRLLAANQFNQLRAPTLGHYAESCEENPTDLCAAWMHKFSAFYAKGSEELKAIADHWPSVLERAKSAYPMGKVTQTYKAPDLDQQSFDAAISAYLAEHYKDAAVLLGKFVDEFPKSTHRFRARYWLGQALTHLQEHERAQRIFEELQHDSPLSYYGMLAAVASGKPINATIDGTVPLAAETDIALLPQEMLRIKRARTFIAEGAYEMAALELKDLKPREHLSNPFLVYLATLNSEAKNYSTSFQVLGELFSRGVPDSYNTFTLRLVFPTPFLDMVKRYSDEYQLDPILVLSLIKQESAFDPGAGSGVGAMGLMQLMPTTAVDTTPSISRADLLEPDANVSVGTKYLRKLLVQFNGNIVLALAGYNAGPNAVNRWWRDTPPKRGMLEFIESIPYKETREYVGSIIRNYYWYARILQPEAETKTLAYFWGKTGPGSGVDAGPAFVPAPAPHDAPAVAAPTGGEDNANPQQAPAANETGNGAKGPDR